MEQETIMHICIEDIHILNPRIRNQIVAEEIRQNIRSVGLKRPITVTMRNDRKNGKNMISYAAKGGLKPIWPQGKQKSPPLSKQ